MKLQMTILLFLYNVEARSQRLTSPNFMTYVTYSGKDFIHTYSVGENVSFSYALCDQQVTRYKRKCVLSQETLVKHGSVHKKTCLTRLTVKEPDAVHQNKYALAQVGENGLVLAWNEGENREDNNQTTCGTHQEFLKIRVFDMQTCGHRETKITADARGDVKNQITSLNIVPFDNGNLELVYRNIKSCGKHLRCTRGYDSEYKEFSKTVVPLLAIACNVAAKINPVISSNSILRGYAVQETSLHDESVNLLHPVGEILVTRTFSRSVFNIPKRVSNLAVSSDDGSFGVCSQGMFEASIQCTRFGADGGVTLEFSVLIKSAEVAVLKMSNHPDGGVVLLIGYSKNKKRIRCFEELDVMMVDREGNIREYHSKQWVACPRNESISDLNFFYKKGHRFCYYVACILPKKVSPEVYHLKIFTECFVVER